METSTEVGWVSGHQESLWSMKTMTVLAVMVKHPRIGSFLLRKTAHFSFPVLYQTREPLEALAKSGYRRILSRQISGAG